MHQFVSAVGEYKIQRISKTFNKAVRKVINTMFNVIIWGNYSSSKIYEFTKSNTTALLLRIQAELISNMSDS